MAGGEGVMRRHPFGWDMPPGCTDQMHEDAFGDGPTRAQKAQEKADWEEDNADAMRDDRFDRPRRGGYD